MNLVNVDKKNYEKFKLFLNKYFREGEDENTPQDIIDNHIAYIFSLVEKEELNAKLAVEEDKVVGLVIWFIDKVGHKYSRYPGYGNIFEIGVNPLFRKNGIGKFLVDFVEEELKNNDIDKVYIQAYGPAVEFWQKVGYCKTDVLDKNGLFIYIKDLKS